MWSTLIPTLLFKGKSEPSRKAVIRTARSVKIGRFVLQVDCGWCDDLFEQAVEEQRQKEQWIAESWQAGGKAGHIAVIAVAAVNSDPWCSVALAVGLTAERLVGAWFHYPTWKTDKYNSRTTTALLIQIWFNSLHLWKKGKEKHLVVVATYRFWLKH